MVLTIHVLHATTGCFVNGICRNTLEALVWEKEAEVDRFRDRWPMSLLVSRSRLFNLDEKNKPRDVIAALTSKKGEGGLAILAEVGIKRGHGDGDVDHFSRKMCLVPANRRPLPFCGDAGASISNW